MPPRVERKSISSLATAVRALQRLRRKTKRGRYRGLTSRLPSVYRYKQTITGNSIVSAAVDNISQGTAIVTGGYYFQLNDLPQVTTFTGLYDQYKIDKIRISFIPCQQIVAIPTSTTAAGVTVSSEVKTGNNSFGIYGTVIDYDDASVTSYTLQTFSEFATWRMNQVSSQKWHTRTFRPHIAVGAYASGVFTGFTNKSNQWLDCASPTIQHYGIKLYADIQATAQTPAVSSTTALVCPQTWRIMATYWVSFRNVR